MTAMKTPSCSVNIKEPCARRRAWILRLRVKCLPLVDRWWTWKWTGGGALGAGDEISTRTSVPPMWRRSRDRPRRPGAVHARDGRARTQEIVREMDALHPRVEPRCAAVHAGENVRLLLRVVPAHLSCQFTHTVILFPGLEDVRVV